MSLFSDIQDQLASQLAEFSTIGLAWTTQPTEDFDADIPAALYYLSGEVSDPSPYSHRTIQPREVTITVLIVCNLADLETRLPEVRAAMVGFQPTGDGWDVFEHDSGEAVVILGGICWFEDRYTAIKHDGS